MTQAAPELRGGNPLGSENSEEGAARKLLTIGVLKETEPGEQRVAIVPESLRALAAAGVRVLVESGAGAAAFFPDSAYEHSGSPVVSADEALARADALVSIGAPGPVLISRMHAGQAVIGMLAPLVQPGLARQLADQGLTAISLDCLPRTVSRAQAMDALTSQANIAGYKAVLVAADHFGRIFPMLITAAGTAKPASVLVLGAGVAGLQAMGTARRLGAMVTGYDVRPETRDQVESVGARFLELESVGPAGGQGGYARALTSAEQVAQQEDLGRHIARFDIVITTAQVPGRRPPLLVTAAAVAGMQPGAVVVDLAASSLGGNVDGSQPGQVILTDGGARIIGAGNLAAQVPTAASTAYSHNIAALLADIVRDGALDINPSDEIQAGVVITYQGKVIHPAVGALLDDSHVPGTGDCR